MSKKARKNPPQMIMRNGLWHLRMRVPTRYSSVESKKEIHRSLSTGDRDTAEARKALVKQQVLADLDAKLAMTSPDPTRQYETITQLAASRSFSYQPAAELATRGVEAILERIDDLKRNKDAPTSHMAAALLGGVERPQLTITQVAEKMPEWFPEDLIDKHDKQQKVWRSRWTRPVAKFTQLMGQDPIFIDIPRIDAVALRDALKDRVMEGDLSGSSAQKEISLLNLLWEKYHDAIGADEREVPSSPFYNLGKGFSKLGGDEERKLEVPLDILQAQILAPGSLRFMNDELRDITLIIAETGARQSEITDLPPHSIFLDNDIPHVWIRKETGEWAREIKNKPSKRKIPLLGAALDAMKRHHEGFPRYRGKGTYSAAANKVLHEKGLLPAEVTIGGLRHSFETRMRNAGFSNEVRAEMMGHSVKKAREREVYGDEMSLKEKLEVLKKISLSN